MAMNAIEARNVLEKMDKGEITWDDNLRSAANSSLQGGGVDFGQVPSAMEFARGLGQTEDVAVQDIVMQMRSREKPLDIYGRLETEAGVPELRATSKTLSKQIAGIEDYLDQIEPDVSARTRESLVTEAQRRGMVASEREPFLQKLGKLGTSLGRIQGGISEAMQGVGTKVGLAVQGQEMDIEPLKMRYTALVDRNARIMTGFTADRQTQLDMLFDKLNRQRQLDDREWALANELSQEERQYTKTLQTAAANAGVKLTGGESNDALLSLVGTAAAEQLAFTRRQAGKGTETERTKAAALIQLRKDVQAGVGFGELIVNYKDQLPDYQIRAEYNVGPSAATWGPAWEQGLEVRKLRGEEEWWK